MDSKEALEDYALNQGEVNVPLGCDSRATTSNPHVQPLPTQIWETGVNNPIVVPKLFEQLQTWSLIWLRPHQLIARTSNATRGKRAPTKLFLEAGMK
jgi:hypothetical protein